MKKVSFLLILWMLVLETVSVSAQQSASLPLQKLQAAELIVSRFYVDPVNEDRLVETAIVKMLGELDPHSTYTTAEEVRRLTEPLQGEFEGIGVQFEMIEDTMIVVQPVSDGPSDKAGVLAGDRIIAVNDTAVAGVKMQVDDIMRRLRGPKGSKVYLTLMRPGVKEHIVLPVKRDMVPIFSVDTDYMAGPQIGYIRINRFAATTYDECIQALASLRHAGMKDLILDLQGNGGGYLKAAVDLANEFLKEGDLIVYTQGRNAKRDEFRAQGNGILKQGRVVILVDEYTASASEVLSGALQDNDRAIVVGRRSFGKGLVQRPFELPDGSLMRLTVSRYYTPAGRCIQKPYEGGEGTSSEEKLKNYQEDILKRFQRGELNEADSIHLPDSLRVQTLKLGRTVYGGGGIMPDFFVPIDTTGYTPYYRQIAAKGIINQMALTHVNDHRKELQKRYKSFAAFDAAFEVPANLLEKLKQHAETAGMKLNEEEYKASLPLIRVQLKALVARSLWRINEYYQVMNAENASLKRALQLLTNGEYERILKQ